MAASAYSETLFPVRAAAASESTVLSENLEFACPT